MKGLFLCIFCCLLLPLNAQLKIGSKWCFGYNAGLDFSKTPADTFTSSVYTGEGSAGVTDEKGNLIFYTDGFSVFAKDHSLMPNGIGLTGSSSSSQAAIVLQHQSQVKDNQFYIFTVPEYAGNAGFCYSIVDMDENGGLGDVVLKNVKLAPQLMSEQMQPALHSNGKDYWIVIKSWRDDSLHSYLIDQNGVKKVSSVGNSKSVDNTIGTMRFNSDYSKLAYTCYDYTGYIELFDFNNTTGEISNILVIDNQYDPYGLEFSPDGSKLYVGHLLTRKLYQYDLSNYNASAIGASKVEIANGYPFGQMRKAFDSKYYLAISGQKAVSLIANPNAKGMACDFRINYLSLGTHICGYGLPLFYQFSMKKAEFDVQNGCVQDSLSVRVIRNTYNGVFKWYLNDGSGYKYLSESNGSLKLKLNKSGSYQLKMVFGNDSLEHTFKMDECSNYCKINVPNAFSPNNDSLNDVFRYNAECFMDKIEFTVFNRWGELLYKSNSANPGWDGKYKNTNCPDGTYFYIISYSDIAGDRKRINGLITLIR